MTLLTAVRLTAVTSPRTGIECGHIIVELLCDEEGISGLGEMSDFQHLPMYHVDVAELERTLTGLLSGLDPHRPNDIARVMAQAFPAADSLYDKASLIRCGIDLAVWDLRAKLLGLGVGALLGGRVRDSLPIAYPIFRQQRESDVVANLALVARMLDRGFHRFRVYVGRDLELDEAFLIRCAEEYGGRIEIKSLDFSNLLDARDAARFVLRTRDVGYDLVEAPARTGDLEGLRFVRERTLVPVSEHAVSARSALELVTQRAVDVVNIGLFVLGGITGALRAMSVAEAAGIPCLIGTTQELSIGTAAAAHVGTCATGDILASDPVGPLLYGRDVVSHPLEFRDASLIPPEGPGLGVTLSPEHLAEATSPLTWTGFDTKTVVDRTGGKRP